jgi:hypothetical protein
MSKVSIARLCFGTSYSTVLANNLRYAGSILGVFVAVKRRKDGRLLCYFAHPTFSSAYPRYEILFEFVVHTILNVATSAVSIRTDGIE